MGKQTSKQAATEEIAQVLISLPCNRITALLLQKGRPGGGRGYNLSSPPLGMVTRLYFCQSSKGQMGSYNNFSSIEQTSEQTNQRGVSGIPGRRGTFEFELH